MAEVGLARRREAAPVVWAVAPSVLALPARGEEQEQAPAAAARHRRHPVHERLGGEHDHVARWEAPPDDLGCLGLLCVLGRSRSGRPHACPLLRDPHLEVAAGVGGRLVEVGEDGDGSFAAELRVAVPRELAVAALGPPYLVLHLARRPDAPLRSDAPLADVVRVLRQRAQPLQHPVVLPVDRLLCQVLVGHARVGAHLVHRPAPPPHLDGLHDL
mmetsp:Transcript_23877/g.65047  ORF Transcript_23877/g.65047 Transcript_23877/m.65047 type:complete len:215 (+) Transcript_23877:294-938(+)